MGVAMFYHLTRRSAAATCSTLLPKSLDRGRRVAVRGTQAARRGDLVRTVWLGAEAGGVPRGLGGGASGWGVLALDRLVRDRFEA